MVVRRFSGFTAPCLPLKVAGAPSCALWVHEIKHDGYRLMVRRDGSRVRCFTRNGHDWADRFTSTAASIVGSSPTACAPQRASFARSAEDIRKSLAIRPKIVAVHLAHFPKLATLLQPIAEDVDHAADDGIGHLDGHGTAPLVAGVAQGAHKSGERRCAGANWKRRAISALPAKRCRRHGSCTGGA
jgi:hypothetical protein